MNSTGQHQSERRYFLQLQRWWRNAVFFYVGENAAIAIHAVWHTITYMSQSGTVVM